MIEKRMTDRQIGGGSNGGARDASVRDARARDARARDALDEKLVALLCENARLTLTALAQKLNLSRTAVQARLARLERDKVITGYRAILGERPGAGEDAGLSAVLSLTFTQRPCAPVVEKFRHWPEIVHYYSVTGAVDAFAVVRVGTAGELAGLVDRLSGIAGVGGGAVGGGVEGGVRGGEQKPTGVRRVTGTLPPNVPPRWLDHLISWAWRREQTRCLRIGAAL